MTEQNELDEHEIAALVADLISESPDLLVGVWGLVGRGERILQQCTQLHSRLVWLGDSDPTLHGALVVGSGFRVPVSAPSSLGMARVDVLVLGVRSEAVDQIAAEAKKGLKNGATIVSVKGVEPVVQNAYEGVPTRIEAAYSPWNIDSAFKSVYSRVAENTMVDRYLCYELWQLVEQVSKLDSGALIEVGVWKGGTGALIAKRATLCGISDPVYLCDTFKGIVKSGELDSVYRGGEHDDCTKSDVVSVMERLKISNYEVLEGIFPEETGERISETQFRFCHVDVDTYESAKDVVDWVWPRLNTGGIIVFDDYCNQLCDGITAFVDEMREMPGCAIVHNLNGHAVAIKF